MTGGRDPVNRSARRLCPCRKQHECAAHCQTGLVLGALGLKERPRVQVTIAEQVAKVAGGKRGGDRRRGEQEQQNRPEAVRLAATVAGHGRRYYSRCGRASVPRVGPSRSKRHSPRTSQARCALSEVASQPPLTPSSTTRSGGSRKKAVAPTAFFDGTANSGSRHAEMPSWLVTRIVSRPEKYVTSAVSVLQGPRLCLDALAQDAPPSLPGCPYLLSTPNPSENQGDAGHPLHTQCHAAP